MTKKPLVVLTGPTAVGKTSLSIKLAKRINGEIISADSMQVYKYMDIGTAKIRPEEMEGIKHYLVDEFNPDDEFNVVKFKNLSKKYIEQIYEKGKIPIIVGGTGFYIQSVLYDIDFNECDSDTSYRKELEELAKTHGNEYIHDLLREVDEESANEIHYNNVKKVIRALEYYKQTGKKISVHNKEQRQKESCYNSFYFVINDKRELLYEKIEKRVDIMVDEGLVEEVKDLYCNRGYKRDLVSMQGLGYKEIIDYLENNCSLEEAIDTIKKETRHFAKRQLTWFRREKNVIWLDKDKFDYNEDKILDNICSYLNCK